MANGHRKEISKRQLLLAGACLVLLLVLLYVGTSWLEKSRYPSEDAPSEPYIPSDAVEVDGQYYLPRNDVQSLLLFGMTPGEEGQPDRVTFAHLLVIDHEAENISYLPLSLFVTGNEFVTPDQLKEKALEWLPMSRVNYKIGVEAKNMRSLLQLAMDISAEVLEDGTGTNIPDDPAMQMLQLIRLASLMNNDVYQATAKIYVFGGDSLNLSNIQLGNALTEDYIYILESREVFEDVKAKLGFDYSYSQIQNMLSVTIIDNTRTLDITVQCKNAQQAEDIANAYAELGGQKIAQRMATEIPSVISQAQAVKLGNPEKVQEQELLKLVHAMQKHLITDMSDSQLVNELWKIRKYTFQGELALCSDMQGRIQHMLDLFWKPME